MQPSYIYPTLEKGWRLHKSNDAASFIWTSSFPASYFSYVIFPASSFSYVIFFGVIFFVRHLFRTSCFCNLIGLAVWQPTAGPPVSQPASQPASQLASGRLGGWPRILRATAVPAAKGNPYFRSFRYCFRRHLFRTSSFPASSFSYVIFSVRHPFRRHYFPASSFSHVRYAT